ncbi:MAG: choice-of-anchor J domain-containing protein [Bacteroidales bacterium]|nr:choice-of-anchor J domain-containing protein [Bacteroidales bacterium]
MKKHSFIIITIIILALSLNLSAQTNTGNIPESFKQNVSIDNIDHVQLPPPSMDLVRAEDAFDEKNGLPMKISRLLPVNVNVENSGTWSELENGKTIWQLRLSSEGAVANALHFDKFILPQGSSVFVYNYDRSIVMGPYTNEDNPKREEYAIGLFSGDDVIIEYTAAKEKSLTGDVEVVIPEIQIAAFSFVYRGAEQFGIGAKNTGYGASASCQVNVNCPEGNNWRTQQKGVARIYFIEGQYGYFCSGSLVNNTRNNQTPYFLTADHCGGDATTSEFNQWIFKFNYESSGCTSYSEPYGNNITGCTKKSRGPLNGGSDFLLLELNTTPTNIKNIGGVYNGWSKSTSASPSGVSIHHPSGDIKKISTYTTALTTTTYYGGTGNTGANYAHWNVKWATTATSRGVTEGGSSGSPIFNSNGLVVGTLSGGLSACTVGGAGPGTGPDEPDLYGKLSYHWTSNGSSSSQQLKYWLDPDDTGATTCDFLDPNNIGLIADFSASTTTVATGGQVSFTDLSMGGSITSRSWSFPGGTPSSSTATNPTITYNTAGTYNVTLTVNTSSDSDTETKYGYITVTSGGGFSYDFENCTNFDVDNFYPCTTYDGDGASSYGMQDTEFTNEGYTGAFIAFNSNETVPALGEAWAAHGGVKNGACFAATTPPNNDWFITPKITLPNNSFFTFWAKSATDQYGLERFNVLISTTNNSPSSFTKFSSAEYIEPPITWTKYSGNLSAYNGQSIYLAIQCVSSDAFAFLIDDLLIQTNSDVDVESELSKQIHIYPNPTDGIVTVKLPEASANICVRNILGQEVLKLTTNSVETNIDLTQQKAGIYFVEIKLSQEVITKRITIN